jgi:hypothetical protein
MGGPTPRPAGQSQSPRAAPPACSVSPAGCEHFLQCRLLVVLYALPLGSFRLTARQAEITGGWEFENGANDSSGNGRSYHRKGEAAMSPPSLPAANAGTSGTVRAGYSAMDIPLILDSWRTTTQQQLRPQDSRRTATLHPLLQV